MDAGKKWLLVSPFSGELHNATLEEAMRLTRWPVESAGSLREALDRAQAEAAHGPPVAIGTDEGWMVVGPFLPRRP